MKKKVLVFGGTGFIGSAIVDLMISNPKQYDIWMLVRRNYDVQGLERVKIIRGDLENFNLKWLDIINPDLILHLARINGKGKWGRRRAAYKGKKANVRLINAIKSYCPKAKVIYVSGTLVYGSNGDRIINEKSDLNPTSYAREYINAEKPWMEAMKKEDIKVSMMRPPWILGAQSWFGFFFIKFMKKYNQIPMYGDGSNWMSIIDLTDCAGLILHYIESKKTNSVFNVSNPNALITMREFTELIQEETGLEITKIPEDLLISKHGKATTEAFTFSLKSTSLQKELIDSYSFKHLNIKNILKNNINLPL